MDSLLTKRVYYFRDLLAEYPGCRNPQIQIRTLSGIDIACIINGSVHFYTTPGIENCLEAFITCDDCYQTVPLRIVKCFCDDQGKCPDCQYCDPNGNCIERCPDAPCVNDVCYECSDKYPCSEDKVCNNGKCECLPGYKKDALGICRRCIINTDCDACQECFGFECVAKQCPGGYINPKTCGCVECYDNIHCTEPNTCCDPETGTCKCCPGYYKDPVTNLCTKIPDCVAGECPPCFECKNEKCTPQGCPPGHVHVGTECCLKVCDCSNPDCPPGYSCWPVPGKNICVCRSCNVACINGTCPEWCDCNNGNCTPRRKKCHGYCDENTPCPNGCGCNLETHECQDCTGNSCVNNDCDKLIGCRCTHQGTGTSNNSTSSCEADPCHKPCITASECPDECGCNKPKGFCEPCDRPCDNNLDCEFGCYCHKGTKRCRKNPCPDKCQNGGDCGPGCGCWDDKGCYPCDSFDCLNCDQVNGCKCTDGVNCNEKKTECDDRLFITSEDSSCQMTGHLVTKSCCSCPKIGYHLEGEISATGSLALYAQLRKGHDTNSPLLDTTGILLDFPPIQGVVGLGVTAFYLDGSSILVDGGLTQIWGGIGSNGYGNTIPVDCGTTSNPLMRIEVVFHTDVTFLFSNDCEYTIPAGTKMLIAGCGKSNQTVAKMINTGGCRRPVFTWYKNDAVFRKTYATKVSPGFFQDIIGSGNGLEGCAKYRLNTDCGCDLTAAYSCHNDETRPTNWVPCNPIDMNVTSVPNTCNRQINIDEVRTCGDIYDGRTFQLYLNDVLYGSYTVVGGLVFGALAINYPEPVTKVELRFPCDDCKKCSIIKTLSFNNPCGCSGTPVQVNITGTPSCESGFSFTFSGGEPKYKVLIVRNVAGQEHEHENFEYPSVGPVTVPIAGPLDPGTYIVKVTDKFGCEARDTRVLTCCNLGSLLATYDCNNQDIVINRSGSEALEYNIGAGWFALAADNKISQVLANGSYPAYVQLRKLLEPTCNATLDLEVSCDTCDLNITFAQLNGTCDQVSFTTNNPTDQYSIGNNSSWVAGVSPINLPAALNPGQSVRIYVRNSADPQCYDFVDLQCSNCTSYNIGTPDLTHDCATGKFTLSGLQNPPIPAFCPGGYVNIKWRLNGGVWNTQQISISFWAANIEFGDLTMPHGSNVVDYELELMCPTGGPGSPMQRCELGNGQKVFINTDTLLNITYDCVTGISWSGTPVGPVQLNVAGVWTNIVSGHKINTAGSYLIRDLGAGVYCAAVKNFTVPNCGGGGGGGSTPCDQAAALIQAVDDCNGNVTVTNGYGSPVNINLQIRDNNNGTCTGANIFVASKGSLAPGATHTFTNVPSSNGTKTLTVSLPTGGDGCSACKVIGICTGGSCNLTVDPIIECVDIPNDSQNRIQIKVTNANTQEVLVYRNNFYVGNVGAGATATLPGFLPQGTYTIKFVCFADVTVFRSKTQNLNC